MNCREAEPLLTLLACEELESGERAAVEAHLTECESCRVALENERRLVAVVAGAQPAEPDAFQLASCRNDLNDALDLADESKNAWRRWAGALRPSNWFGLHPAWGAALCLLVGITLGNVVPRIWNPVPVAPTAEQGSVLVTPTSTRPVPDNAFITGMNLEPASDSGKPQVKFWLRSDVQSEFSGAPDDMRIRGMLTYVVQNGQQFDPGLRLDSIELLKSQGADAGVRQALCHAARHDANPGVRLKAVEALREMGGDEAVRTSLIDALLHDDNPGVRVEAINALRTAAEATAADHPADPRLVEVLRDRMQRDPSTYVRLQSAAAIRQLGPRASY